MRFVKPLQKMGRKAGATILEVLIVLSIIALIAAVVGPRLVGYLGRAKTETAELQVKNLAEAVQLFYIDMGRYPTTSEGLGVLVHSPAGEAAWQGPYMPTEEALVDPWGRDYLYEEPSGQGSFKIQSQGRDGTRGGTGEDTDVAF
ncbi:type II secretion system major pseudopilin GspG [Parasulfitobacter algicola]|nr:type II secretion system major pseudopilin GspG [Sulfitobacter algicola]